MPDDFSPPSDNPFDQIDPKGLDLGFHVATAQAEPNPFGDIGTGDENGSSILGAAARGAERSVIPAAGGLVGAGAGAAGGAALGEAIFPPGGAIPGGLIGGIAGALGVGFGGSYAASKAQDYALSKAPDTWKDSLGLDDRQERLDQEQHPYASFMGGLVPYALTMRPGGFGTAKLPENATALQRLMANPATARVIGGGLVGGMELGQEYAEGDVDWNKVAISTAFGMVFNKPNRLGETIEGTIPRAFRRAPAPEPEAPRETAAFPETPESPEEALAGYDLPEREPTLNEANAFGISGPGATEATFLGSQARDPTSQATANSDLREENATVGPLDEVDVDRVARNADANLFGQYDALREQRDALASHMRDLRAPDDEEVQSARARVADLQSRYDEHLASSGGYTGGVEARKLRAQIRESQRQHDDLVARKAADNSEALAVATAQYQATDFAMRDLGLAVGAARRRAAERTGAETVPPVPVATEAEEAAPIARPTTPPGEPQSATKPLAEQKASIAEDVKRQLIAAGRPEPEAEDIGTLVANRYAVRAGQFKGALGTAEGLYRKEGARFEGSSLPKGASEPLKGSAAAEAAKSLPPPKDGYVRFFHGGESPTSGGGGRWVTTDPAYAASFNGEKSLHYVDLPKSAPEVEKAQNWETGLENSYGENQVGTYGHFETSGEQSRGFKPVEASPTESSPAPSSKPAPQRRAAKTAKSGETKSAPAPTVTPEEARAKANSLEVANLVDTLLKAGATPKEIEAVVGKKMTAEEIQAMAPQELRQGAQGSYTSEGTRGVIRLFEGNANASTAIHELGHDFLEQMKRDAGHEQASLGVRADWQTVKRALRLEEGAEKIKTSAHEQFARWFEQYLYEGTAPSKELAGVFSRFKNWLANVYKTVADIFAKRQVPISPDIKAVFDRMLSEEPNATVISREAARSPTLPDIHADEAKRIEPVNAASAAERIASERAEAIPPREAEHEVAPTVQEIKVDHEARAGGTEPGGEAGSSGVGSREVERAGNEAGAKSDGIGVGGATGEKREGGNGSETESPSVPSGQGASGGRSESGGAVRNQPLAPGPNELLTPPSRFVDKAGNIRLDNVNGVEDLKTLAREIAKSNNDFVGNRRGVISDAELLSVQAAIGDDRVTRKTLGEASNAEEGLAIQRIAAQAWREMASAASTFKQSRSDADLMLYIEKQQRATMMQAYYSQATAEAGRALRAMRKVQEFWSAGAEGAKGVTEGAPPPPKPGDLVPQATGRTLFQKAQEALLVASYEDPQSVARFNTWTRRHSFGRMILEYWINGLLSGTATHTTYVIGNTLLSMERGLLETPVAAAIGALRPAMGRDGGNVVRFGEAAARLRGAASGYAPALAASADAFRTGLAGLLPGEEARRLPFQVDGAPPLPGEQLNERATMADAKTAIYGASRGILDGLVSIGKILDAAPEGQPNISAQYSPQGAIPDIQIRGGELPVGQVLRAPSRVIASIHTFFKAMNYSIEKHAEIYRQTYAEGDAKGWNEQQRLARMADLTNNTPEDIVSRAAPIAGEMTLMQPASDIMRKIQAITNHPFNVPLLGETPLLKFVDPFVQIAASVIDQTFVKRTPLGFLAPQLRADLMGASGAAAQDMAQARMIVGSVMALGFGALAAKGYVTGSGPMDRNQAAMWRLAGNQAHSVRIGDTWYQMNRLGPLGMLLGTAADLYDVAHAASKFEMLEAANLMGHAVYQNVLDESFMRGPSDLIQAIDDPGRYGERYIQNFASSFVPMSVGLAQLDRASDPYSRQARTVVDAIRQKVPGLSESLLPKRDIWGEPIPNRGALLAAGVTAIYESRMSQDPVNMSLAELGIGVAPVDHRIANIKLTDQQYDDYARLAGRMLKQRLDLYARSPDWRQWPTQVKVDAVKELTTQSRTVARGMLMAKYPSIMAEATRVQKSRAAR